MKKLMMAAFIAVLGLAFVAPAFAVEHDFGGYWRTRMYTQAHFNGVDANNAPNNGNDESRIDTRTRLYYTAVLNDNLKFVNKFEFDTVWGSTPYGDIGTDGVAVEVKNSYADFNVGALRAKVGAQGLALHRGFVFDDDFAGAVLMSGPTAVAFMKFNEASVGDNAGFDTQAFSLLHTIDLDTIKITPNVTYVDMPSGSYIYFVGADVDVSLGDAGSIWATLIYEGGNNDPGNFDYEAYLGAVGGSFGLSDTLSLHGQVFYATGEDSDADFTAFGLDAAGIAGQCYYWSEIMGYGIFDNQVTRNSPDCGITNILAANFGAKFGISDALSITADVWYAKLVEYAQYDDLGTEIDLKATYKLVEGLNLDLVAAYMFVGDATSNNAPNDKDPFEVGARLSLSF